ncbi:MAG: hypothetical protein PHI97_24000 [Desulfobulbus sp.]|nr:hypothetical protein [Desulfobulbus sp.]
MSTWFTKNLGDAMLAYAELKQIEQLFTATMRGKTKPPDDAAVFFRHESEGGLHCEVKVYLSPSAADVAAAVCAHPCSKPSSDGLDLLIGSTSSWSVLFPGT